MVDEFLENGRAGMLMQTLASARYGLGAAIGSAFNKEDC